MLCAVMEYCAVTAEAPEGSEAVTDKPLNESGRWRMLCLEAPL